MPNTGTMAGLGTMASLAGSSMAAGGTAAAALTNPFGWAVLGAGVLTDVMGTGAERKAGERKKSYIQEQQDMLSGALPQMREIAGMKTELATDVYGTQEGQLMSQTGESLYGLTRQGQSAAARTGFANSEQINTQVQRGIESGAQQFGFQRQGLQDVLGQKLMDISEWKGAEEGRLASEQSRLKYEMAEAQAQSKKKFLGIL